MECGKENGTSSRWCTLRGKSMVVIVGWWELLFLTLVSVDKNGKSKEVPRLTVESIGEQAEWEVGKKRSELRKMRMKEGF